MANRNIHRARNTMGRFRINLFVSTLLGCKLNSLFSAIQFSWLFLNRKYLWFCGGCLTMTALRDNFSDANGLPLDYGLCQYGVCSVQVKCKRKYHTKTKKSHSIKISNADKCNIERAGRAISPWHFFLLYRHLFYMMPGVGQISLVDSETNDIGVVQGKSLHAC